MNRATAISLALAFVMAGCTREDARGDDSHAHVQHSTAPVQRTVQGQVPGMSEIEVPYERQQAIGVRSAAIERRPLAAKIRTVGVVVADERQVRKVQTKISGWVDRLLVNFTGQYVAAGQPILSIYSPELVATEREYLLALEASRTPDKGGAGLGGAERKLLVESARDRLRLWDITDSQIRELERSEAPRRTIELHSPIAGFVTMKPVYQGMYITPDMELYTVADLKNVWVWADVYEDEIGLVRVGQRAEIYLASAPGSKLASAVSYVSPTMDLTTRTVKIRFDVPNPDGRLKPGMYATMEIESPLGEVLALPDDAVIDTGERKVVFVQVGDSTYQPREVNLGRRTGGYYQILGGLSAGERVVTSAQFLIDSESRLRSATGAGASHGSH